ncbi:hypothetical protein [Kitasatospora azatica]|uniref:hypothetical protein n=1 Tax=Kitasatospora azatica TaxID=58347 RepID=UPI00056CCB81|nr:hypothetical protein [Kitasatospora azatica]
MTSAPRRLWWIAPTVSTVLALPLLALACLILMFVGFAYDSCDPGGCPGTDRHVLTALAALLATVPLAVGAWLTSRLAKPGWGAALCVLAPLTAAGSVLSFLTIPAGR